MFCKTVFISLLRSVPSKRSICFDWKIAQKLFYQEGKLRTKELKERTIPGSWKTDYLHSGTKVKVGEDDYLILCRTTNYACVIQDIKSRQVFTVKVTNLPKIDYRTASVDKSEAINSLLEFLDPTTVEDICIRFPIEKNSPLVFSVDEYGSKYPIVDKTHPYMIVSYKNKTDCLAFRCTWSNWAPHRSPMHMLLLDGNTCPKLSLWDKDMDIITAVDLSRMATFPKEMLSRTFKAEVTRAILPAPVMEAAMQIILCHVALDGCGEEDDEALDELDIGAHPEVMDCNLVIGHYEVDDDNMPLDCEDNMTDADIK